MHVSPSLHLPTPPVVHQIVLSFQLVMSIAGCSSFMRNFYTYDQKRLDIQGLRGISIIAVILFHCRALVATRILRRRLIRSPHRFFIISGFLIASILSREPVLTEFYKRRFIRIVPPYAAMLLVSIICAYILFASSDFEDVTTSMPWCLLFARNLQQIFQVKDYWAQSSEFSLLLHTWSLAVEIQFYLVAPFMFSIIGLTTRKSPRIVLTLIIVAASLMLHWFSDATTQFYSLQCRIWQFLLGFLTSYLVAEKDDSIIEKNATPRWIILLSFLLTATMTAIVIGGISTGFDRIMVSVSAASIVLIGEVHQTRALTNRPLTLIGDYSYELYLIHWPAIVVLNYANRFYGLEVAIIAVMVIVGLFLLLLRVCHDVNRPRPTFTSNLIYTGIVYSAIAMILIMKSMSVGNRQTDQISSNSLRSAAMEWAMGHEFYPLPPHEEDEEAMRWTNYTEPKHTEYSYVVRGSGNLSILLLGNSFGFRASPVIADVFAGEFNQFRVFTELGCPILTWQSNCTKFRGAFTSVLERMKPDITWVIAREPLFFVHSEADLLQEVQTTVEMLKLHSKYVVIDGQSDYYGFTFDPRMEMIRRLQLGIMNFSDIQMSRENHKALHSKEWAVMLEVKEPIVLFNNISEQMCDPDICPLFNADNLRHYYGDKDGHMNQEGLKRLRIGYETIARELTNMFESAL